MSKLIIKNNENKKSSVIKTIRFNIKTHNIIDEISKKAGISFNKTVNQCIEYALNNLEDNNLK